MAITVSTIDKEFSPAEVENITGVSTALQRDWRRRGILPPTDDGKWSRFKLRDLIEVMVLKTFSDAGFSVKEVAEVSNIALLPTFGFIAATPGASYWDADFEVPVDIKMHTELNGVVGASGRYLVMINPGSVGHVFGRTARFENISAISEWALERQAVAFTVLDLQLLAEQIVEKAGPVIRYEAKQK